MITVTVQNVLKLATETLQVQLRLAYQNKNEEAVDLIEAELDRRDEIELQLLQSRHRAEIVNLRVLHAIREEIHLLFGNFRGEKTLLLIERLGDQFIDDYYVDEETCTVYSKVSHSHFERPSSWEFETLDLAKAKVARLIYYRIYDHYMREASRESLERLRQKLRGF